jgi:hypothetical protein
MQVNTTNYQSFSLDIKASIGSEQNSDELKEKIKNGELSAKSLSNSYLIEFSLKIESYSSTSTLAQSGIFDFGKIKDLMTSLGDLKDIGYNGKSIDKLSTDEAAQLVSEDGFFGVAQTSKRLSDFVLAGGGNDIEKLKAGRNGIIDGFKQAEAMWGDKLPDISYDTLNKALEQIDKQIESLGANALDLQV